MTLVADLRGEGEEVLFTVLLLKDLFHSPFGLLPFCLKVKMIMHCYLFESFAFLSLLLSSYLLVLHIFDDGPGLFDRQIRIDEGVLSSTLRAHGCCRLPFSAFFVYIEPLDLTRIVFFVAFAPALGQIRLLQAASEVAVFR